MNAYYRFCDELVYHRRDEEGIVYSLWKGVERKNQGDHDGGGGAVRLPHYHQTDDGLFLGPKT